MQIIDMLSQMGGLQSIAKELGVSEAQAASGAAALTPAILGGFKKTAQAAPGGLDGLGGLLGKLGGGNLLDNVLGPQPTDLSQGNGVLGQIFGSKDVSRAVAQNAASKTGLAPSLLKKMLPMLAMMVTGYLARQHASSNSAVTPAAPATGGPGGLAGVLGHLMEKQGAGGTATAGGSAPGIGSLLDMNQDGNPLDDIMQMAGKALR